MTDCIEPQLLFSFYPKQKLLLRFDGGEMTSDAGLLLLRQFDQRHGLTAALAEVLTDERREASVDHVLPALLRQRIYQIVAGYEDGNDADRLRHDATFQLLAERSPGELLASQPTLSRWENRFTERDWVAMNGYLCRGFAQLCRARVVAAGEIVLDIDSTADPTYGQQEFSFYNGAYDRRVYHPLLVFERHTGYLLAAHLRRGEVGSSRGCVPVLRRLVRWLQRQFPGVPIRLVGDAGFAIPALYDFCERWGMQYSFGIGTNPVFQRRSQALAEKAQRRSLRHGQRQVLYSSFRHRSKRWRQQPALCHHQPPGYRRRSFRLLSAPGRVRKPHCRTQERIRRRPLELSTFSGQRLSSAAACHGLQSGGAVSAPPALVAAPGANPDLAGTPVQTGSADHPLGAPGGGALRQRLAFSTALAERLPGGGQRLKRFC